MAKPIKLKSAKKQRPVADFIASLPEAMQAEAKALLALFEDATKTKPRMWGNTMVGFGEYDYTRSNGDYGTYFATGFALRKSGPTIYIMPGYQDYSALLAKLGPHKLGKSCLYIKSLDAVDTTVLKKLIETGLTDLKQRHPVRMQ